MFINTVVKLIQFSPSHPMNEPMLPWKINHGHSLGWENVLSSAESLSYSL